MAIIIKTNLSTSPSKNDPNPSKVENIPVPLAWVGSLLIAARKERGMTQAQLAERLGMLQEAVARWEREKYRTVSLERLVKVAEALETRLVIMTAVDDSDALEGDQNTEKPEPV